MTSARTVFRASPSARPLLRSGRAHRILAAGALTLLPAPLAAQSLQLSAALVAGGDVTEFELAPDGSRAFYRADQDVDGAFELYSVSLDGGAPIRLNGALAAGGGVASTTSGASAPAPTGAASSTGRTRTRTRSSSSSASRATAARLPSS